MSVFLPIVFLLTGLASGAMLVWLALRSKTTEAEDRGRLTAQAEHAALIERLQGKEAQIHTAGDQLRSSQTELSQSRAQLQQESKLRATAEANAARIPELNALLKDREQEINQRLHEIAQLRTQLAHTQTTLDKDRTATEAKLTLLNTAQQQLANAFKVISTEALKHNNESFLSLAETVLRRFHNGAKDDLGNRQNAIDALVQPLKAALDKVDGQLAQIENNRTATYATLAEQVKSLGIGCARLQTETANLVQALRAPQVRGRWGEIQLKRVAEMAGMIEYCGNRSERKRSAASARHDRQTSRNKTGRRRLQMPAASVPGCACGHRRGHQNYAVARTRATSARTYHKAVRKSLLGTISGRPRIRRTFPSRRNLF